MKNERPNKSMVVRPSLEERWADHPEVIAQLHAMRDEIDQAVAQGALAHEVEEQLQKRVRRLAPGALQGWAQEDQQSVFGQAPPGAVKHSKKNSGGKASSDRSS
jgi:hypothetical protein